MGGLYQSYLVISSWLKKSLYKGGTKIASSLFIIPSLLSYKQAIIKPKQENNPINKICAIIPQALKYG